MAFQKTETKTVIEWDLLTGAVNGAMKSERRGKPEYLKSYLKAVYSGLQRNKKVMDTIQRLLRDGK